MACEITKISNKKPSGSISGCVNGATISLSFKKKLDEILLNFTTVNCSNNTINISIIKNTGDQFWLNNNCGV